MLYETQDCSSEQALLFSNSQGETVVDDDVVVVKSATQHNELWLLPDFIS